MGKKQKNKDVSKNNKHEETIYSIKKTIKIDIIKKKSKKHPHKNKLSLNSKIFFPKKYKQIFQKPLNANNSIILNSSLSVSPKINNVPKWMSRETQNIQNSYERFNKEITDYVDYIIPHELSLIKRQYTIKLLTHIIQKYNPNWKVILYGSFSQNIATVFSDLDFAIYNNIKFSSGDFFKLFYIMNILQNEGFTQDIEFINARIPILRGTCINTGINFDISFNKRSGLKSADLIRNIVDKNKIIKEAIIFIKILLKENNLNETYTGGMCSYLVFHLVYYSYSVFLNKMKNEKIKINNSISSYDSISNKNTICTEDNDFSKDNIIINERNKKDNINFDLNSSEFKNVCSDINLRENDICSINDNIKKIDNKNIIKNSLNENDIKIGDFILFFLKYYGFEFDYKHIGFSVNEKNFGQTFEKVNGYQESTISVEGIEEEEVDIGIKCYNYDRIIDLFQRTYIKIKMERDNGVFSILSTLKFPIYE